LTAQPDGSPTPPDTGVTLSWSAVEGANAYVLSTSHAGSAWKPDQSITSTTPGTPPPTACSVTFNADTPAGDFNLSLVAEGYPNSLPSPPSAALVLNRLAAPQNVQATVSGHVALLSWLPVPNGGNYRALVTDPGGRLEISALAPSPDGGNLRASLTLADVPGTTLVYQVALQALPAPGQLDVIAGPPSAQVGVTVTRYANAGEMAKALYDQHVDGAGCGPQLLQAFPGLEVDSMAAAMAQAGYAADETSKGLLAAWPQTSPLALSEALAQAYPTAARKARGLHDQGVSGAACGPLLLTAFPALGANDMATSMAQAGYAAKDTANGLKAAFPALTPIQLAVALKGAYPRPLL
jgi:hypothetical protein